MNKRKMTLILACVILFTAFTPAAQPQDVTLYASDGRTIIVPAEDVERWVNVGWYKTPEDAAVITLYATDGRTLEVPEYHRQTYLDLGWYNTKEEVTITMYAMDGRTMQVYKDRAEAQHSVGWYYNLSDVTVTMYDGNGNEHTVFKNNVETEKANGLSQNKNDVMQVMFSAAGEFIHVPYDKVEEYKAVGWYSGGTTKIDPARPMVAITFDDGPGKHTDRVLSILEKYNARATFFVQGKNVPGYASVMKRAVSLNNEIGNHTYSHVNLSSSSTATISQQINATNTAVYNATGVYPKLYRPPYGAYNSSVLNCIAMPAIMWSVDTLDWKHRNPSKTLASVQKDTKDGAIILMHDIHEPTADSVESVVRHLLMNGYQLVTVSELIETRQGSVVNGRVYNSVKP
ncbi:MAG: hypothetical protein E7406_07655 [Ruminococcaceae bacterium]|nr:hypothetical protein [Oscillospiraceae bacterium]